MMNMRSNLGIASHSTRIVPKVPCLSMRSRRNSQRQRQRASTPTATQVLTTVQKEYKEKSRIPNNYLYSQPKDINTKRKSARKLINVWKEVQGSNNWEGLLEPMEGLLEPMDHLLCSELIKYKELAQACYNAFDFDPYSKYYESCKYNCKTMFQDLGLSHSSYKIT